MASISAANTSSVPGPSSIPQDITATRSQILSTCFYKRTKYYFPHHDPQAKQFSKDVYQLFSRCYKTEVPNLGILARLPPDILEGILLQLDIDSFRRFRQVSRRARYLATALIFYQRVLRHAQDALNALRRTDLSGFVSYSDVYTALTTTKCAFCGQFGDFLFLSTAKRCCFECLHTSPETALVNATPISRRRPWKGLHTNHADAIAKALKSTDVRSFKTHNWDYVQKMSKTRGVLAKDALAAYIKVDSTLEELGQGLLKPGWLHYRLAASIIFPSLNIRTGRVKTGVSCTGCHLNIWKQSDPTLFFFSRANISSSPYFRARDRSYSEDEAALHFSQCPESQRVWRASGRNSDQCMFVQQGGAYHFRDRMWRYIEEDVIVG
ncbi:hypothetical protein BFJ72_g7488 [Fusarium proliferatum]|uniref:F-box domain-containing protein n=1 Tax=Gibberella intermedia TaxID=948311 RepID=A0A420T927_GIBIN|nr:hypothetical protein BFJ72_g7488 [Fusarium proliferatum]